MYKLGVESYIKDGSSKVVLTKFLTVEEQCNLSNQKVVDCYFSNNYDEEIRKRAIVCPKNSKVNLDFKLTIYELIYDDHFGKITHPQILGSILALGITRDVIGDILVGDKTYIIVCDEISKYLELNFMMVNKTPISLNKVDKIENAVVNYDEQKILISSMRLDLVVSKTTNLSREKSKDYINAKYVRVNGAINTNNDYNIKVGDIISILKYGRIIIDEVVGASKKDKIILKIKKTRR